MSNVINLRMARKTRAKSNAKQKADENAIKHGRTKAQKSLDETQRAKDVTHLDGHKREP